MFDIVEHCRRLLIGVLAAEDRERQVSDFPTGCWYCRKWSLIAVFAGTHGSLMASQHKKTFNAKACIVGALSTRLCGKKIREEKDEEAG